MVNGHNKPTPWWVGHKEWGDQGHQALEKLATAEEMLEAAGQNYELEKRPIFARLASGTFTAVPDKYAVVRGDTQEPIAVIGARYELLQRSDAFRFFNEVVGEGLAVYDACVELDGGRKIAILAELPEQLRIRDGDIIKNKLLLVDSCDGSLGFRFFFTPIRVICENTLNVAIKADDNARAGYYLKHVGINQRISAEDAREAIGLAGETFAVFSNQAKIMADTPVTQEEIEGVLQRLFPIPADRLLPAPQGAPMLLLPEPDRNRLAPEFGRSVLEKRDVTRNLIRRGLGNTGETRWDVVQGVAEVTDHVLGTDKKRTENLLFGTGQKLKTHAWDLMTRPGNWWEN